MYMYNTYVGTYIASNFQLNKNLSSKYELYTNTLLASLKMFSNRYT